MKTRILNGKSTFFLLFFSLLMVSYGWGQTGDDDDDGYCGFENFDNAELTASYTDGNFVGSNGVTWTYIQSRNENGDANNSGIDGNAIMLRRASDDSKIYSDPISTGIGNFSVKLYKGFTGAGNRQVELFVNGASQGTSDPFNDYDEHIFSVDNINISGDVVIEIKNIMSTQIIIDDISWTCYYDCVELEANIGDACLDGNGDPGVINENCDCVEETFDCEVLQANFGDACLDGNGDSGVIDEDCECVVEEVFCFGFIEDFSDITNGNSTSTTGQSTPWAGNTNFPTVVRAYQAGGAVKLGTASDVGSITSRVLDEVSGDIEVRIKVKGWTSVEGKLKISIDGQDEELSYTAKMADSFEEVTATFTGVTAGAYLKIETTAKRAFIDEVEIFCEEEPLDGYVYENGTWLPEHPAGSSTSMDNIWVVNGSATGINALGDTEANNVTIMTGASLDVRGILNVQGNLDIQGDLIFLSGDDYDGELGVMGGTITGEATVHRYMMDKRSFRVVASSVTTTTSIRYNWQENGNNEIGGYGTHITGSKTGDNGFDATSTGSPSMYNIDYSVPGFMPINNTNSNTLSVGTPYLLFVRGDRQVDLGSNSSSSATVLRATGELHQGDFVITGNNHDAGDVLFITNPYQCAIDLKDILENSSSNVNSNYFYLYDPAAAEFGAYITYNVYNQTTLDSNTDVNQYLQPGQAVQVLAMAPNPTVTINEGHKAPGNHTTTQRPVLTDKIVVQLYTTENYTNQGPVHDSFGIYFDSDYSNEINMYDAVKPMNFYENLGIDHDGAYYSIEQREMPQTGEVYQLYSAGYTHSDYTLKLMMEGLDEYLIYLDDHYTGNSTLFVEGEVAYAFEVNNDPLSSASDRFSIRVEESFLSVEDSLFAGVSMYPNPVYGDSFTIQVPNLSGEEAIVTISDLLGREIQTTLETLSGNALQVDLTQRLDNGIYLVSISVQGETKTFKLIKR